MFIAVIHVIVVLVALFTIFFFRCLVWKQSLVIRNLQSCLSSDSLMKLSCMLLFVVQLFKLSTYLSLSASLFPQKANVYI